MQFDGIYHDRVNVILKAEDLRLLADLCNDLPENAREFNPAHREALGAALETAELAMRLLPADEAAATPA
jgi:hypothetical protein